MRKKIYIVNTANNEDISSIPNDYSYPALSVLSLATWLEQTLPSKDLEIIARDQSVYGDKVLEKIKEIKPYIVAISVLCTSYQNTLEIGKVAKEQGAYVIFGNDHASQLGQEILKYRENVDYIIGSEYGERTLELLTRHLIYGSPDISDIAEVTYRENGEIKGFNFERDNHTLYILDSPNYKSFGLESRDKALDIFPYNK